MLFFVRKGTRHWVSLLLLLLGLEAGTVRANTFLRLQSTCLGDGWFQYRMQLLNDPFFSDALVSWLTLNFTNQIDQGTAPLNWTNIDYNNPYSSWSFSSNAPARPYEITFLVRSSETAFKMGVWTNLNGSMVGFSLTLAESNPVYDPGVYTQNIVGIAYMPCLIPCRPEEADGSPTNFVFDLKLVPDLLINQLVQTDGILNGVDFIWDAESTFLLQGTADFNQWTNIAYIWSYPPETTWTTNRPLNDFGQFFRLATVAYGHTTNLPPLNSYLATAPKAPVKTGKALTTPRVTGCRTVNGRIMVDVATQPNQTDKVQAVDSHRVVLQTRQITATGTSTTVDFDIASLPNPVFFQVVAVP
jgi:hypothetical protein